MTKQMKLKQTALLVMGLLPLGVIAQPNNPQPTAPPAKQPGFTVTPSKPVSTEMPEKGKLSYAIGMYFGRNITNGIKRGDVSVDTNTVLEAITDVVGGKPTRLSEKEVSAIFDQLKVALQAKKSAADEEAKIKGEAFLAQFAKAAGVVTLSNGLEYKVIKEGTGPKPNTNDSVKVSYRGTLSDGTEFDRADDSPNSLRGGVIPGWRQILPLMTVGSKWEVAIPSALGYGTRGKPPKIPGNSVLVFDMELKSIMPAAPTLPPISPAAHGAANVHPATVSTVASSGPPPTPVVSGEIIKVPSAEDLKKGAKIEVIKDGQTNAVTTK
jgi:FKBP-type peptidyl-prolyl cis-trans isomerase FkpA